MSESSSSDLRALDARLAEFMGWEWKRGGHYDVSSIPADRQIHLLPKDESIAEQPSGEFMGLTDEWPPVDGRIIWNHMPEYSTSLEAFAEVLSELDRRGLGEQYVMALREAAGTSGPIPRTWASESWQLLRATPEQCCRAA